MTGPHRQVVAAVLLAGIVTALPSVQALAQDATAPREMPWPVAMTASAFRDNAQAAYLTTVLDLLEREDEAAGDAGIRGLYFDILGTHLALVGEAKRALRASDDGFGRIYAQRAGAPAGREALQGYRPVDAVEAIVARAGTRRLVMVNEEHRSTLQRAFTNRLLEPLSKEGFRYLAVEAVAESAAEINQRGYPVLSTGSYTRDPVFGDLIRRAIAIGYQIVPYEASAEEAQPRPGDTSPLDATNRRERAQARNIYARTFQRDPEARVLVVAGRDHIAEMQGGDWTPMGAVLKELSGIDPLTINQSVMTEHSLPRFEHWAFAAADKAGWLNGGPVLLVDAAGSLWSASPDVLDAYLFHPRSRYEDGRPDWMRMGGLRKPVAVELPDVDRPILLQAHLAGETPDAVPVDQIIVWPGTPRPTLMLRAGRYRVRAFDREGVTVLSREIVVEN